MSRGIVGRRATDLKSVADASTRSTVLVVDDHPDNLRVVELILEPLELNVITAGSGEEALRILLEHDIAVIVLDVRMPGMDGFETAAYVKRRERTRHVPIIFLTAVGNDREQALSGYEAGAVDFIEKPIEPLVLCAKVATFAELHASRLEVARQSELLRAAARREADLELQEAREAGEQRYRDLAEAMPSMVFAVDSNSVVTYRNQRWDDYTGGARFEDLSDAGGEEWELVHPGDRAQAQRRWAEAIEAPEQLVDGRLELQVRLRRADGAWLWHDVSCRSRVDASDKVVGWVGTATEVDRQRRSDRAQRTLAEAGAALVTASDLDAAMTLVAEMTVPAMVDWCSIDVVDEDGAPRRIALRVDGDLVTREVERLGTILPPDGTFSPTARVLQEDGPARLVLGADGSDTDGDLAEASAIVVPLMARGHRVGVVSLAVASLGRDLGHPELTFARALATRLASAVDNARLYRRAEERAQAAEVLDTIADGVVLVDREDVVRLWNPAAAFITGVPQDAIIGRRVGDLLPDWATLAERVPIGDGGTGRPIVTTTPLTAADGRDVWLSVSAVGFARGVAYAFRDLTEERAVERMKSDFVATVSHELRTPLASIYGAAVTLQREDLDLDQSARRQMLDIIGQQSEQLASIVDDVLTASRLDAGEGTVATKPLDAVEIAREVVEAARSRASDGHDVRLEADDDLPEVAADPSHLRQVLDNLVENAIKYSPHGGAVTLCVRSVDGMLVYEVRDEGLGIAPAEQRRIFEKFYRVDANMSSGIGGTGLGLFIVRELVRGMSGQIDVRSTVGDGTCFEVRLPHARPLARSGG